MKLNIVIWRIISPVYRECMNHWRIRFDFDARYARTRLLVYFKGKFDEATNQILFRVINNIAMVG